MTENVSAKQNAVIAALLCSGSVLAAAEKVGCSPRTIHRYLKNESFKVAYREAKSQLLDGAINLLRLSSVEAVRGLVELAKDVNATSSARVSAWCAVLNFAIKGDEVEFVKEKLTEAEANRVAGGWRNHV
ncbi:MAG: hypothetical protein WCE63_07470 [Acidobacteriaceae bacterium]